jgi:hypothetical protein
MPARRRAITALTSTSTSAVRARARHPHARKASSPRALRPPRAQPGGEGEGCTSALLHRLTRRLHHHQHHHHHHHRYQRLQ